SAQLIGEEAAATGAVDFQAVVQLFDAVLDVGAVAVDRRVQMARGVLEVSDHEARIVFRLAIRMAHDLGLDDDAAALLPGAGGVAALAVQMRGLARFAGKAPGRAHRKTSGSVPLPVGSRHWRPGSGSRSHPDVGAPDPRSHGGSSPTAAGHR